MNRLEDQSESFALNGKQSLLIAVFGGVDCVVDIVLQIWLQQ